MAYSEKLSDINKHGEMLSLQKSNLKDHNSVKILWMTSKFTLDLYFMMLYPSVNFE